MKKEFDFSKAMLNSESLKAKSQLRGLSGSDIDHTEHPSKDKPTLRGLVEAITDENIHGEIDWGRPVGKELV